MSESLAFDAAWLFAAFLTLLVAAAAFIAVRRFLLERGGGTVECGLRRGGSGPWRLGVASYQLDELRWYNAFGISQRPEETFGRRELTVVSRREPDTVEEAALGPGRIIVECRLASGDLVELGLSESALTGLLAWLEAAPPRYPLTLSAWLP